MVAYRLTVEPPDEPGLVGADVGRRDGRRCAINVQLLVQLVLIPQAADERSVFGNLCVTCGRRHAQFRSRAVATRKRQTSQTISDKGESKHQ